MECQVIEELRYKASAFEIAKAVLGYSGDKGAGERLGVLFDPASKGFVSVRFSL